MYQTQERAKKLVLVLATFTSVTDLRKEIMLEVFGILGVTPLQCTLCIQYPVQFQENPEIQGLINFGNEINAMTPTYTANLSLCIGDTNIKAQKIDELTLVIDRMVIARFLI